MARFFGKVGYGITEENPPNSGVWVDRIEEYDYQGDVIRVTRRLEEGGTPNELNLDITINNSISVVADEFANQNFTLIKYVQWMGTRWTVTSVEVRSPRLILTLGKVYNGPIPEEVD